MTHISYRIYYVTFSRKKVCSPSYLWNVLYYLRYNSCEYIRQVSSIYLMHSLVIQEIKDLLYHKASFRSFRKRLHSFFGQLHVFNVIHVFLATLFLLEAQSYWSFKLSHRTILIFQGRSLYFMLFDIFSLYSYWWLSR